MKKKKLNLKKLAVNSFLTSFDKSDEQTVKGGYNHTCPINEPEFRTTPCNCGTSFGPRPCNDPR